jgi:cytochrome c biogenesis protein ResB
MAAVTLAVNHPLRSKSAREGIEDHGYLAESKGIFENPKKSYPQIGP